MVDHRVEKRGGDQGLVAKHQQDSFRGLWKRFESGPDRGTEAFTPAVVFSDVEPEVAELTTNRFRRSADNDSNLTRL